MRDLAGFLAQTVGVSADPLLVIPAIAAGVLLRDWRYVLIAAVAIGLALEVLMAAMGTAVGPYPFGRFLLQRIIGAGLVGLIAFAIRRLAKRSEA